MKRVWFTTLLICSMVVFTYHHSLADNVSLADDEMPAFSNPAQAGHAADLAEAVASEPHPDTEEAAQDVQEAEDKVEVAKKALASVDPDDDDAMEKAKDELDSAKDELEMAEGILDEQISELTGATIDAIAEMRSTMGWGQIAHYFGFQLGQVKRAGKNTAIGVPVNLPAEFEIAEATRRDVKHGWAKGHGMSTSVASSSKKGLGLAETDLGVGRKGSKASKGNSGSKSSSANSSKGNSKGDRGAAGGPSNGRGNSGNSSSGKSKSDRGKNGGPSNDQSNNGNNGNDKGNSGGKGNKGGNSGKSK